MHRSGSVFWSNLLDLRIVGSQARTGNVWPLGVRVRVPNA